MLMRLVHRITWRVRIVDHTLSLLLEIIRQVAIFHVPVMDASNRCPLGLIPLVAVMSPPVLIPRCACLMKLYITIRTISLALVRVLFSWKT